MIYITYICIFALICVKSHIGIEKSASRLHEQTKNNNVSSIIFHLSLSSEVEAPFSHAPRGCWTSCNFSLTLQIALFSLNMLEVDYVSGSDFCVNTGTISRILPLRCTLTHTLACAYVFVHSLASFQCKVNLDPIKAAARRHCHFLCNTFHTQPSSHSLYWLSVTVCVSVTN